MSSRVRGSTPMTDTTVPLVIGRSLVPGADGSYPVFNPARPDEVVLMAPVTSPGQLDQSVLQQACDRAMAALDLDATAALLTREHGKVLVESLFDVATTAGMVGALAPLVAEALEPRPAGTSVVEQVAHGVVAAILPFNWPAAVMGNKILPALLAGNTVVVKTPPTCPGAVLMLAGAIAAGLPAGVLSAVNGPSPELGAALVAHPDVDMVSFTGGISTGRSVLAACASRLRPAPRVPSPRSSSSSGATIRPSSGPTWSRPRSWPTASSRLRSPPLARCAWRSSDSMCRPSTSRGGARRWWRGCHARWWATASTTG